MFRDGSGQADDQMLADALVGDLSGNRMDTEQGNPREGRVRYFKAMINTHQV